MNEYQQERYNNAVKLCDHINSLPCIYKFKIELNDNGDGQSIRLINAGMPIFLQFDEYRKKYNFFLWDSLAYVNYHDKTQYKETHPEPQQIGVLNAKKINAWINYLQDEFFFLQGLSIDRSEKIALFLAEAKKIEGISIRLGDSDNYRDTSGDITKNGINYSFTIDRQSGYISQKIDLSYKINHKLDDFLKLSNNEWREIK